MSLYIGTNTTEPKTIDISSVKLQAVYGENKRLWPQKRYITFPLADRTCIECSSDFVTWNSQKVLSTSTAQDFAYGNGIYVIVDSSYNGYYSTDCIKWHKRTIPTNNFWSYVAFGDNKFVVVTYNNNKGAYSLNGIDWTEINIPTRNSRNLKFCNDKFFITTYGTNDELDSLFYSYDGINWAETDFYNKDISMSDIAYGNGIYVVTSNSRQNGVYYSENGINWTQVQDENKFVYGESIAYGNGKFVISNSRTLIYSENGIDWTYINNFFDKFYDIVYFYNNMFIQMANGVVASDFTINSEFSCSIDAINWNKISISPGIACNKLYCA